jgi:hypothetical protein
MLKLQAGFELTIPMCGWGARALKRAIKVIGDVENEVQKRQSSLEKCSGPDNIEQQFM